MKTRPLYYQNMDELRAAIDALDASLVGLLADRADLIDQAVVIKTREGLPARIQTRVDEVLDNVRAKAEAEGLDPELVIDIWQRLIGWSIDRENQAMGTKNDV